MKDDILKRLEQIKKLTGSEKEEALKNLMIDIHHQQASVSEKIKKIKEYKAYTTMFTFGIGDLFNKHNRQLKNLERKLHNINLLEGEVLQIQQTKPKKDTLQLIGLVKPPRH